MITVSQVAACIFKLWAMNEGPEVQAYPAYVNKTDKKLWINKNENCLWVELANLQFQAFPYLLPPGFTQLKIKVVNKARVL